MRKPKLFAAALVIPTAVWTNANATLITSAAQIAGPVDVIDFSDRTEQEITLGPTQVGNLIGRESSSLRPTTSMSQDSARTCMGLGTMASGTRR